MKTIRKFAKWQWGNNSEYPDFCKKWVTTEKKQDKPYLTPSQVDKLIENTKSFKIRTLIAVLFGTGMRIEECCNIRRQDITKRDDGYYQFTIRDNTSKTGEGRKPFLLKYTEILDIYLRNLDSKQEYLFTSNYNSYRATISRLGKNILNISTSPHIFRHSSATYFAKIIKTYQSFCNQYGWKLNSSTADRYYHRDENEAILEQVEENEVTKFKYEFERLKLEKNANDREMKELNNKIKVLQDSLFLLTQQMANKDLTK